MRHMNEQLREAILAKISQIRQLVREVKDESASPAIESFMRNSDVYCMWAEWSLGGVDIQIEAD